MFSSKAGRKHLISKTKHNRLAIVTMHRGQKYQSLDAVKKELEDVVCNLAPATLTSPKVIFTFAFWFWFIQLMNLIDRVFNLGLRLR